MAGLYIVKVVLELDCLDEVVHVYQVTAAAKLHLLGNIVRVDSSSLPARAQELLDRLDFVEAELAVEHLIHLGRL